MPVPLALAALGMIAVVGAILTGCENKNEAQGGSPGKGPSNQNRPERPSDSPSKRPSSNETSSSENSSSSSVPTEFPVAGDEFASNDPTVSEEKYIPKTPEERIQNKTHWCWATCAIIVTNEWQKEWLPRIQEEFMAFLQEERPLYNTISSSWENGVNDAIRPLGAGRTADGAYYCEDKQSFVVQKITGDESNNIDGNVSQAVETLTGQTMQQYGDFDENEYWLMTDETGNTVVNTEKIQEELINNYKEENIVANAYTESKTGHSLIITRINLDGISLHDPMDGNALELTLQQAFLTGFHTSAIDTNVKIYICLVYRRKN